jgi:hypothetical protein
VLVEQLPDAGFTVVTVCRELSKMTERQRAGIGLLVVTVLAALVVARLGGARVAGTATMTPGVKAPVVGECLVSLIDKAIATPAVGRPASQPVSGVSEDKVRFAECTSAPRIGEVVGLQRYPHQSSPVEADIAWCQRVSDDHWAHENYRYREAAAGLWKPSTGQRFVTVHSRPNVDLMEPRWAACVLVAPNVEQYSGSYVRSLADAPAPSPFGLCLAGTANERWVSCADRHRTQELGEGTGAPMTARDAIETCRSLVARMTRMPDITAEGRLLLEVVGGSTDGTGGATANGTLNPRHSSAGSASCRLTVIGEARLVGTLIGVGEDALPIG